MLRKTNILTEHQRTVYEVMSSPKKQNFISTNLYPPANNIISCKRKTNFQCGQWRLPKHIGHQNTFSTWSALCMNNKSKMHYRTYHLLGFSWAWDLIFFLRPYPHPHTQLKNILSRIHTRYRFLLFLNHYRTSNRIFKFFIHTRTNNRTILYF